MQKYIRLAGESVRLIKKPYLFLLIGENMYIFEANAFYNKEKQRIYFKFEHYGCWEVTPDLKFSSCKVEAIPEPKDELAIDIIEHRVYAPRIHYFLFDIPSPFDPSDIYVVVRYDGSSASVEKFFVADSLRKARKFIKSDTVGLKRRV